MLRFSPHADKHRDVGRKAAVGTNVEMSYNAVAHRNLKRGWHRRGPLACVFFRSRRRNPDARERGGPTQGGDPPEPSQLPIPHANDRGRAKDREATRRPKNKCREAAHRARPHQPTRRGSDLSTRRTSRRSASKSCQRAVATSPNQSSSFAKGSCSATPFRVTMLRSPRSAAARATTSGISEDR
jgi:hypothetical protein